MSVPDFGDFVCAGDSVRWKRGPFQFVATVEYDNDTRATDFDQPGWYLDTTAVTNGAANKAIIDAWKNNEWWFGNLVVTVSLDDQVLATESSCGIEINFPAEERDSWHKANGYLSIAAEEMENELMFAAKKRAKELIKKFLEVL